MAKYLAVFNDVWHGCPCEKHVTLIELLTPLPSLAAMGFVRLNRLFGKSREVKRPVLEVDWSVISPSSISIIFKDFLADLLGVPRSPTNCRNAWRGVDVKDLYRRNATGARFLIRGVIYDMPALIQKRTSRRDKGCCNHRDANANANAEAGSAQALFSGKDWTSIIHSDLTQEPNKGISELPSVSAAQVVERLGVQRIPGMQERIADVNRSAVRSKLEEKQKLEELLGTGDGVRAKYMGKIRHKKMMAEARREREKFDVNLLYASELDLSTKGWRVTPGSPALVRYLEERGISQALIAHGDQSQLNGLLEGLRNYKFQHVRNLESVETMETSTEKAARAADCYHEILNAFCGIWGLPPRQVLLVIGDTLQDDALHKAILGSQFFVCKVRNPLLTEDGYPTQHDSSSHVVQMKGSKSSLGLISWFKRLSEGTLHEDGVKETGEHISTQKGVHFSVMDMTQLKWIIEDLNGVSYRSTTFVQGFSAQ